MEKAGITMGKFIVGLVIAILVSIAVSAGISTQLIKFMYALPDYDSGWVDITNNIGKYFNVTHNLNSEDIIVDIRGKATASDGAHQRHFGLIGNTQWTRTYGETDNDMAWSMVQTSDGGYVLAGYFDWGAGDTDFWLVKTDSAGNQLWNEYYGDSGAEDCHSVVQTADEGYALAGYTDSFGAGGSDFWLVKTDSAGNPQWNKIYGGIASDAAYSVVQTADGGYALGGSTRSFGAGGSDFWLVKTDVESGLAWTDSTANTITLYRGATDIQWNYVRVRIWKID